MTDERLGAYGLALPQLVGARPWMQPQPAGTPTLSMRVEVGATTDGPSRYDAESADLGLLGGGRLQFRHGSLEAHYVLPSVPPDADLLHPYLAPAAALVWRWGGHEALHAGAFAGRAGAVLLLGAKAAGKSTTLAWLADTGVPVLSDDLAVIDGAEVLAGPRSIDLRPESTQPLSWERPVRGGERRRKTLAPAPGRLPVAGAVVLEWADQATVVTVPADRRFEPLALQRSFPALDGDAMSLLEIAAMPMIRVTRPRGAGALEKVGKTLLARFG